MGHVEGVIPAYDWGKGTRKVKESYTISPPGNRDQNPFGSRRGNRPMGGEDRGEVIGHGHKETAGENLRNTAPRPRGANLIPYHCPK